jgi:hypothetical protein
MFNVLAELIYWEWIEFTRLKELTAALILSVVSEVPYVYVSPNLVWETACGYMYYQILLRRWTSPSADQRRHNLNYKRALCATNEVLLIKMADSQMVNSK